MARCFGCFLVVFCVSPVVWVSGSGLFSDEEAERRWNTPPKLTPEARKPENEPQPRFLVSLGQLSLNTSAYNGHTLSFGGNEHGLSLSHGTRYNTGADGHSANNNAGSGILSGSQSTSFAIGPSGFSAAEANAFNLNHPIFGGNPHSNSNSFSLGEASSSAHGHVLNNQAVSGAQSSVGSGHALVTSGQDSYNPSTRPQVDQRPVSWSGSQKPGPNSWSNPGNPSFQGSAVSAVSGASSSSSGGFSSGQSSSESGWGPNGPTSSSKNHAQSWGSAQSSAQGAAAAAGQHSDGKVQGSFSSGVISANSMGTGHSQGSSVAENGGHDSQGHVTGQAHGISSVQGSANAGSVSFVRFPDDGYSQNIPREYVRSNHRSQPRKKIRNPIDTLFTDITDTVIDLFE